MDEKNKNENSCNFEGVIFEGDIDFRHYEFKENVNFTNTEFRGCVKFNNAIFHKNCTFNNTKFNKDYINNKIFEKVKFEGQNLLIHSVKNLPRMDGIILSCCTKIILSNINYNKEEALYGKINYRIARNQARIIGDHERIGHYYYKERDYGSKTLNKSDYPTKRDYINAKFFDVLSRYTLGYGERPWNILYISLLIISIFAFLYILVGIRGVDSGKITTINEFINVYIDTWYFSMVTFSTVGYGDMIVTTILGKILVSIEVFFGLTMGATWASVIIKRMIR
ncbi:MAG: ion channel [Romboutsia sp.]